MHYGHMAARHLGRTAAGVAVAVGTSLTAIVVLAFVDTADWTANSLPGDATVTDLLALAVIVGGTMLAMFVDDFDGQLRGVSFGCYLVATSTGMLAIGFGYVRFWCDRATAVIVGLIDKNQDVSHWSARALVPGTGQQVDFDTYSRDSEGVAIGHQFDVIVDPRGWTEPVEPVAADLFYPAAGITVALFLALFVIAAVRAHRAAGELGV